MSEDRPDGDVRTEDKDEREENSNDQLLQGPSEQVVQHKRPLILPEVAGFLYFLALVTQYPVMQFWLFDHFSKEYNWVNGSDSGSCSNSSKTNSSDVDLEKKVQSETNKYIMYTSFISNFVAIFPALFLGPLTDKFGRKFVFFVSFFGLLGNLLMSIFVFHFDLKPAFLCISSLFLGLSGSFGLFLAAGFGIVADITSPGKQRAFRVTTMEATIAIASSIGSITSGIWVKEVGYLWPMAVCIGEIVLATFFVLFFVPETLLEQHYHPFSFRTFLRSFEFYVKDTPDKRRFKLIMYVLCFLTVLWAFIGETNFNTLYLLHEPFCWSKVQISVFNGALTLLKWIVVVVFIILTRRWISEPVYVMIGSVSAASSYLLKGLAKNGLLILIGGGASLWMDLVGPMCRTLLSKSVSRNEQGALFAGIGVLQMIVSAVSGVVMSNIYSVGLDEFLGLPYLVLTGFISLNIFLIIAAIVHEKRHPVMEEQQDADAEERLIT